MTLPPEATRKLEVYRAELARWGTRINLVGSVDPGALSLHIQESLRAGPHLEATSRVVDLGSGAGLPGIPLAIARPDVRITLVDRREKRANFIRYIIRLLEMDCEVLRRDLASGPPGEPFDVALMRAVAPLERARKLAGVWLGPQGRLWLWTRETATDGEEIEPLGERGRILRLTCPGVSRGTRTAS